MTLVDDAVWAVPRLLVTEAAAGLSEVGALDVSRRAAASIIHVTGVSAGAVGVLPADALRSGANRLAIAVVTSPSRLRGAAALVDFEGWTSAAGTPTSVVAAAAATEGVTGTAAGIAFAATGDTAALEVGLTEVSVAEVEWAGGEAGSPGNTLCFGRCVDGAVDSSTSLADELVWAVGVCGALP